jgi:hypothetical protein
VRDSGRATREQQNQQRPDADEKSPGDVERVVHPAVHAGEGDEDRDEDRDGPRHEPHSAVGEAGRDEQGEADVDGDDAAVCPDGKESFAGRSSSRFTAGRSRGTTSEVTR